MSTQTQIETGTGDINVLALNIADLPRKLTEEAFNIILQRAYLIQGLAQTACPVRTGNLRDHIWVVVGENSEQHKTVNIEVPVPYAAIVEARQPFLGPAVDSVLPELETALRGLQETVIDVSK
ncbi:MAG: hypothetical protein WC325_08465 [Candidatus Bathyarchaeia archaeon]|jgi:hypothetical protein